MNLMVVAHPDDEVLFGYKALTNGQDWHIICCTNASNDIRTNEFRNVMEELHIKQYDMWDYKDEWGGGFPTEIQTKLTDFIQYNNIETVYTHNIFGEYGHTQHIALYKIISGIQNIKNLYSFGRNCKFLPYRILESKMRLLSLYESQYNLDAYDWVDTLNHSNNLMKYVCCEGYVKVR